MLLAGSAFAAAPDPASVAVLYNSSVPESKKLADTYRAARNIPAENLIGLPLPKDDDISRKDYDEKIAKPLRAEFTARDWWKLGKNPENLTLPVRNRIRYLVTVRGVPLRILNTSAEPVPNDPQNPFDRHDEASVDSELSLFGIQGLPTVGIINNAYFKSEKRITDVQMPFLFIVGRIDAANWETCERMIRDAVSAEKTGLWGKAYVDLANKFPQGDEWLRGIADTNFAVGIPTVVDLFHDSLPTNYPMTDASLYYGWYEDSLNGPFLNPAFQFRPGAVAMHIHSFSAGQIRDPFKNWSAGLLSKGAACTVGNVHEPYLGLTHHFDILHKRLLDGYTFGEAAYAATPALSWQTVVFGDPLYRPFIHLDGGGEKTPQDNDYRALRLASMEWGEEPDELNTQLSKAAERTKSGVLAEGLGLRLRAKSRNDEAKKWFTTAKESYVLGADKARQNFNLIEIDRVKGFKEVSIAALKEAQTLYANTPEASAFEAWTNLLAPPPPPAENAPAR
jgi:uncharacterized protein (TIGR03790 family)